MTTALQRKLIVGALDFSPLRHSPALAERHYYTKNRPSGAAKFEEIRTAGVRYEITARTKSRRMCRGGAEVVFRRNAISRESPVHQRQVGGLEPTVARGSRRLSVVRAVREHTRSESEGEHVCGPDVISTATVNGAREISAGRSPLAKQVARAVRARRNHVGGVPANCGSVSPERSEPRSGRYAGCEQVGPSPRLPKPKHPLRVRATAIHTPSGAKDAQIALPAQYPPTTEGRSPRSGCPSRGEYRYPNRGRTLTGKPARHSNVAY